MDINIHTLKENDDSESIIITINDFFDRKENDEILHNLDDTKIWHKGFAFGREIPRLQRWYHIENKPFSPFWKQSYKRWDSNEYEKWLLQFQMDTQDKLQKILQPIRKKHPCLKEINFNSVLINKYRTGKDYIRQHRDDEMIFNDNPSIVSVSFGVKRRFLMRRVIYDVNNPKKMKYNDKEEHLNLDIELDHGTVLIMGGSSQKYFSHGVPIDMNCKKTRYNLTFRHTNPIIL